MTEAQWLACVSPDPMLRWISDGATATKVRWFATICCRYAHTILPQWDRDRVREEEGDLFPFIELAERCAGGGLDRDALPASPFPDVITGNRNLLEVAIRLTASPTGDTIESAVRVARYAALAVEGSALSNKRWDDPVDPSAGYVDVREEQARRQTTLLRDIFGNPFRPVTFSPGWRTSTAVALASQMYESRDFSAMPILADALQDAGCDSADVLEHGRGPGPHVRGCWVVDLVLGKG